MDWENQNVMLEIEVIRGPGATIWGANVLNGVIKVITKNSAQTQGNLLTAGTSSFERELGSKLEHNDYSDFKVQPSVHWVRIPSSGKPGINYCVLNNRFTNPYPFPSTVYWNGNQLFEPESVYTYEVDYRATFIKKTSLDITVFYNTQVWQILDWWRWNINHSWLHNNFMNRNYLNSISRHQHSSIGGLLAVDDVDFDFWLKCVDHNFTTSSYANTSITTYITLDVRTAWHPIQSLELSITAQNIFQSQNLEYISDIFINHDVNSARGVYGKIK